MKKNYSICKFIPGKIPAVGRILYRRKELLKTDVGKGKSFIDMEAVEIVTRAGHDRYAYVPNAKIRHYHAETLSLLIKKRMRNLERDYLPNYEHKNFTWFNASDPKDVLKVIFWVLYANLFVPETIRGIYKMLRYSDIAFLWQPIVALTTTDAILWGFLSRNSGRKIAMSFFLTLIGRKPTKDISILKTKSTPEEEINRYLMRLSNNNTFSMMGSYKEERRYIEHNRQRFIEALYCVDEKVLNRRGNSILDIGTSPFTFILKRRYPNAKIFSIDYSDTFKELCRKSLIPFKRIDLATAKTLFGKTKFDVITFLEVLEHIHADHNKVLATISQNLNKSGYLLIQTPNRSSLRTYVLAHFSDVWDCVSNTPKKPKEFEHFKEYTISELVEILQSMKELKVLHADLPMYFDHPSSTLVYRKFKIFFAPLMYLYYWFVLLFPQTRRALQVGTLKQ